MRWSLKIATIFGIPIKVHVTFLVLLAIVAMAPATDAAIPSGTVGVILVVLVFGCVLLHELGHIKHRASTTKFWMLFARFVSPLAAFSHHNLDEEEISCYMLCFA